MSPSDILRSPFYRVTLKALVFDKVQRLLVTQTKNQRWELPGGGWEHEENFATCLQRELHEELGVEAASIGIIAFVYRGRNSRGWMTLRMAVPVILKTDDFIPGEDMLGAKFVDRGELLELSMASDEAPIKQYINEIWPPVEKNASDL